MNVLADHRWIGPHGIGRFAREVLARLPEARPLPSRRPPLSLLNGVEVSRLLRQHRPDAYFTPGFNPPVRSPVPFVFCVHDLIHLHCPEESTPAKRLYYRLVVRPAGRHAARVLTVSQHAREAILDWSGWPADRVLVVGNGVSAAFTPDGPAHAPGYPYLLHVGNHKAHKNIGRLLNGLARCRIDRQIKLLFAGGPAPGEDRLVRELGLADRVVYRTGLDDEALAAVYRGALALGYPSLYEGFGLPAIEAMACGTCVACASATSLPEVVGDAALSFDASDSDAIAGAIERIVHDSVLRQDLRNRGRERAKLFSWDRTAAAVRRALEESR